jgi:squalene-associated FAD-dependent desaturase
MKNRVIIIGGGLAGLAAATALAEREFEVVLLESRGRLGGRASSFVDAETGQLIDNCQHVSMGVCTNFAHFCRTVGIAHYLESYRSLWFMTPDRRLSRLGAGFLPAPFHMAGSFFRAHYLTLREKWRIARALRQLAKENPEQDTSFSEWLVSHGQTPRTIERFWGLVLTSALNELPERIGQKYARKVFVDAFLGRAKGSEIQVPSVSLGRLYGEELQAWLTRHRVRAELASGVKGMTIRGTGLDRLDMRDGEARVADWYISSVPFDRLLALLPSEIVEANDCFRNLKKLETSPITSVHLWYARPVMDMPHVVLVSCSGQWVFNRGETNPGEHYVQVVISAARELKSLGHEEVRKKIVAEMAALFPAAEPGALLRARVVTEQGATFSAVPGVDRWRPAQTTPIDNLFLAGDWTATGWPATMEGAVRSGYLAAEAILRKVGRQEHLIQPDL